MPRSTSLLAALILLLLPALSFAEASPRQFVRELVKEVRAALEREDVQGANALFAGRFDMERFGRRCLIDHWDEFSGPERETYVDLLGRNMRKRIGERMLFTKNDKDFSLVPKRIYRTEDDLLAVENTLRIKKGDFKLVFTLAREGGKYVLADYELEGALLSRNYRGQFNYLIRKYGKEGFLAKLKDKTESPSGRVASN